MSTAIITGASSGLGREFFDAVIKFYPQITEIWVIARRAERLEQLAETAKNINVIQLALDITDESAILKYAETLKERNPDVKLLINNAGAGKLGYIWELDAVAQGNSISLNCRAMTEMTAITIPYMKTGSAIINTCSIAAFAPTPRMTVYSATKAYVFAFSKGSRAELKQKGINVLAVCPSPMKTEFLEKGGITGKSKAFDSLPHCDPTDVAKKSIKYAFSGRGIYTPRILFKLYRFLAKVLPHGFIMKFSKL
ncbi:MAG: SDR family NAD(P)-dependent oxidoreductase [Clostridia bacterium]